MTEDITIEIKTLTQLLADETLAIPPYQRPYTWREQQVRPLVLDIFQSRNGRPVIMGSTILCRNEGRTDIVDGQQRLTTLAILTKLAGIEQPNYMLDVSFPHSISQQNIVANAKLISEMIRKKSPEQSWFSPDHIFFIAIYVPTLSDAFTFFDSENNRGKKLSDTDILKAHHLRFIKSDELAADCSSKWEWIQGDRRIGINRLIEGILGQGRKFSRKEITEVDIKREFRSQRTQKLDDGIHRLNNYQQSPLFGQWEFTPFKEPRLQLFFNTDKYKLEDTGIEITDQAYKYLPFQITQSIEGGELFFWYTYKYYLLYKELFIWRSDKLSPFLNDLLLLLGELNFSTGTSYVHELFVGALLFYFDKFGYEDLDTVAAHLFFSIYWLRFRQSAVQYASVFKFIREEKDGINPFALIVQAGYPAHLIHTMNDFLEGKYHELWESQGIRRRLFNILISYVEDGYFSFFEEYLPESLKRTLKRPL